jgi:hypothetical protein
MPKSITSNEAALSHEICLRKESALTLRYVRS